MNNPYPNGNPYQPGPQPGAPYPNGAPVQPGPQPGAPYPNGAPVQPGAPYRAPYQGSTLNGGGLKGFFDKLSPMTVKLISMALVVLTLLTFLLPWMQFSGEILEELDDNDVDVEDLADGMIDEFGVGSSSSKREAKEMAKRIGDGRFSLSDLQFVLGKFGEELGDAKEELDEQIEEYEEYGYDTDYYDETMETVNTIITINVVYQILYFGTVALGILSLVTYWLDKRYNGWGLALGNALLFVASIVGVILANTALEDEIGVKEPIFAIGVGGFFGIILAIAACIFWKMYLDRMPAGGVGIDAFKKAFASRRPAYPAYPAQPGYNPYAQQPPMNNGYAQPVPQQPAYQPQPQPTYQPPMNNGYAQPAAPQQPTYENTVSAADATRIRSTMNYPGNPNGQ